MSSYTDYWMLRKRFTAQYATATLMAYIFSVGHRMPHKIMISRSTGNVWMTELLPGTYYYYCFLQHQLTLYFNRMERGKSFVW